MICRGSEQSKEEVEKKEVKRNTRSRTTDTTRGLFQHDMVREKLVEYMFTLMIISCER